MSEFPWSMAPYLRTKNAAEAIAWYVRALGAKELSRYEMPDGTIGHAELDVHGNKLCLADADVSQQFPIPTTYNDVPMMLYAIVPDVDHVFERAIAEGARVDRPVMDQFYGERNGGFVDPFGHVWFVGTPIAEGAKSM